MRARPDVVAPALPPTVARAAGQREVIFRDRRPLAFRVGAALSLGSLLVALTLGLG